MNTSEKNHRSRLPQWQSEKMRSLIEERWSEIWEIVVAREESTQNTRHDARSSQYDWD